MPFCFQFACILLAWARYVSLSSSSSSFFPLFSLSPVCSWCTRRQRFAHTCFFSSHDAHVFRTRLLFWLHGPRSLTPRSRMSFAHHLKSTKPLSHVPFLLTHTLTRIYIRIYMRAHIRTLSLFLLLSLSPTEPADPRFDRLHYRTHSQVRQGQTTATQEQILH